MSIDQIFPKDLFKSENRGRFVGLLTNLPIPPRRRKQTYFEYLKLTDQVANPEEIASLNGVNNA